MIIVMRTDATEEQFDHIKEKLTSLGFKLNISSGDERCVIGIIGDRSVLAEFPLGALPGVEKVMEVSKPYKVASREFHPDNTVIDLDGVVIGSKKIVVIAGPCSVENKDLLLEIAQSVKKSGATILRGGAFKPRTSPYSFQGLGEEGLKHLAAAREFTGLKIITEVMDPRDVKLVEDYTDIIQLGARNMQNFNLLKEVGKTKKPVLLKRGLMNTFVELLMSAEYIMAQGNHEVILCERGIRTFETITRNTLDLSAVPVLRELTHLPIVVDPSHAVGKWKMVEPLSKAAVAVGADGLMIEVHPNPEEAFSDGAQSLLFSKFERLMEGIRPVAQAIGREV